MYIQLRLRGQVRMEDLDLNDDEKLKYQGTDIIEAYYPFPNNLNRMLLQQLPPQQRLGIAQLAFAKRFHSLLTDWHDRNSLGSGQQDVEMRSLEERMELIQGRYDELFDIVDPKVSADSLLI